MAKKSKVTEIHIDEDYCKGCDICIELCPKKVFVLSEKINSRGYYTPIPALIKDCDGCRICELSCPELAVILVYEDLQNARIPEKI
ncbi:MAG: 2-oxoglutarate ferredoxin oxidoreductase subunit delta [Bacteroidota bacterium]|nr:2-oxoglutarate ferredoxin oxidoreductase subunit delta [Bacteroidota bacterium]